MKKRPTERTMEYLRKAGIMVGVVERFNRHAGPFGIRQDLFGCIDLIAVEGSAVIGIQCCSGTGHAEHLVKCLAEDRLKTWLRAGKFEIWSWSKRVRRKKDGSKSRIPEWRPRVQQIVLTLDGEELEAFAPHNPTMKEEENAEN